MSSEVLYRKWRPRTLVEVVGQEVVTTTLRNAVRSGRVGHAYLFCGPRGTGKTSTGRILAKAVNCLHPVEGEPCNECEACVSISDGRCLDIIEIDAASNRGIDDIRQLRERVNYSPSSLKRKVYVIDEVHMLTDAASNALLKTLEEPPEHVMFVLATTEAHKVMATIQSRCQCFNFRRLSLDAIASKLKLVCEREGVEVEPAALEIIARAGAGSLRDAENTVQQLLASHGHHLSVEEVQSVLGIADDSYVMGLSQNVVSQNLAGGLRVLHDANEAGVDMRQFGRQTVETLRNLLLVRSGCAELVDVAQERKEQLMGIAAAADIDSLARATRLFSEATGKDSSRQMLGLELALVDCVLGPDEQAVPPAGSVGKVREGVGSPAEVRRNRKMEKAPAAVVPEQVRHSPGSRPQTGAPAADSSVQLTRRGDNQTGGQDVAETPVMAYVQTPVASSAEPRNDMASEPPPMEETPPGAPGSEYEEPEAQGELGQIRARWKEFVDSLRGAGATGSIDAYLRSACEPTSVEDDVLVLRFSHKFHLENVEKPAHHELIEKSLESFFGRSYKVKCVLQPVAGNKGTEANRASTLVEEAIQRGGRIRR
ncbi:MAG: DNA polymerase III subunit gamma/tau [Dehalococcoidia bacterium]|nr:DNA polymerase III subunit gamma/tau [Dehalococcoidia bacterium]